MKDKLWKSQNIIRDQFLEFCDLAYLPPDPSNSIATKIYCRLPLTRNLKSKNLIEHILSYKEITKQ